MACPKCNHEINSEHFPLGLIYCPYCGEKIGEQEPFQIIPFCMNCGHRLLTEVTFCPECGRRIAPEPLPTPPDAIEPEPAAACETLAPEIESPVIESRVRKPSPPLFSGVKAAARRLAGRLENFFSGRWRLKKLYREWSAHDSLPREEIPPDESLKDIAPVPAQPTDKPMPAWMAAALGIAVLALFEAVGMLIRRPG